MYVIPTRLPHRSPLNDYKWYPNQFLMSCVHIVPGGMPLMFVLSVLPLSVLCYIVVETFKQPFTAGLCGGLVLVGLLFCARTAVASGWKMLRRVRNRSRRN